MRTVLLRLFTMPFRRGYRLVPFLICSMMLAPCQALAAHDGVILLYHHIGNDTPPSTSVTPEQFAEHLHYLESHGFHVLPLEELVQKLTAGEEVPAKSVAITFDDGYRSVYRNAMPLLVKRHWPFAIFVNPLAVDRGYHINMSWSELKEAKRMGGSIFNHGQSHAHLVRHRVGENEAAWQQRVTGDIEQAQARLEAELGETPKYFAYPYGEFTPELERLVRKLGFFGFGQQSGAMGTGSDPAAIPRFPLIGRYAVRSKFAIRVATRELPVKVLQGEENMLPAAERQPLLRLQLGEGHFNPGQLTCFAAGVPTPVHWVDREGRVIELRSASPLPAGRSKYTCTAPASDKSGVYYWYSHLWMLPNRDGSWPKQ